MAAYLLKAAINVSSKRGTIQLRLGLLSEPLIVNGMQHLFGSDLLCHASTQHAPMLKGFSPSRHHFILEFGNVLLADMAVECIEQHYMQAVESVVLNKGPDWW